MNITNNNTNNRKINSLINGPRNFTGEFKDSKGDVYTSGAQVEASAKFWLRRMNELQVNCNLNDKEMLFVAGDKMTNNAEQWWDMCYDDINDWSKFEIAFKAQFMNEDIEKYWSELDSLKQHQEETIEQISTEFKALINLVGDKDIPEREKVRRYLHTIDNAIARDIVKKEGEPITLIAAITAAKQVESANMEFNNGQQTPKSNKRATTLGSNNEMSDTDSVNSQISMIGELTREIEQLKICLVEMKQQQQVKNNTGGNRNTFQTGNYGRGYQHPSNDGRNYNPRLCYNCNSPDHLQYNCPHPPQQQGKDQEQ